MPVHDWTRVEAGIFHDFHMGWIAEIRTALNGGLLPEGFYALAEQHAGRSIADVLALHVSPASQPLPLPPTAGGIAVAEAPPSTQRRQTIQREASARRRSLAIRHVSGHRLIAMIEILSPANKDRSTSVEPFAAKAVEALDAGIHLLLVDLFPPGASDPQGIHEVIQQRISQANDHYDLPTNRPVTLASYVAGPLVDVYLEHLSRGARLPDMPLFLTPDRYINIPLEPTYEKAYSGTPSFWRDVLEDPFVA
ncbi:MAG: DUF4058 family protein [Rhodopirellula sp.]|nr:DUF4058 family protein [Rhodopirellula sp.]